MDHLELRLLGGFELRVRDGEAITLPTRKGEALLAVLALRLGQAVTRERVCSLLWPDFRDEQARHNLRQAVHYVRKALPEAVRDALISEPHALTLDAKRVQVDVTSIESSNASSARDVLASAAQAYRGDLLEGMAINEQPFEEWLLFERERVRALMVSALARQIELHTAADEVADAIEICRRLLQFEPLHEETHRSLMRLQLREGRRSAALQSYQNLTQLLRVELGTVPDAATRALYAELRDAPAPVPTPAPPAAHAEPASYTVGRRSELQALELALSRAWEAGGGVHLLVGEAGVGKTHVSDLVAERAQQRGARVLRGRCFESEQVLPLALWSNLLRSAWLRENSTLLHELRALPPELRTELSVLLPELDAPRLAGGQQDTLRTFNAVLRTLRGWIQTTPLLLILEDLHWADEMSLRLLCYLARHQAHSPGCFVLGSLREEELAPSAFFHAAAAELDREQLVQRVHLTPLTRVESVALAQRTAQVVHLGVLDEPALEQLWSLSEGNPLVIVESARSLAQTVSEGAPRPERMPVEATPGMRLPERVRALVRSRVQRVSPAARDLLAFAAVAGRELGEDVLECSGLDSPQLTAALDELLERQLMRAREDRVYFTHDRIRETLYSELSPARRRLLHGAVADALERRYADRLEPVLGHIGYHHSNAGNAERAVHFLLRFAELAWRGHGAAEALAALERAALDGARLPSAEQARLGLEIVNRQAFCLASLGRFDELLTRLEAHRAALDALDDAALAGLFHFWWGLACTMLAKRSEGEKHALIALEYAQRRGDARSCGYAHSLLAYLCAVAGRWREGLQYGEAAVAALAATTVDHDALTLAWLAVGLNHLWHGECREAFVACERAEAIALAAQSQRGRAFAAASLGYAYAYVQQWTLAIEAAGRGLQASSEPFALAHALWISGLVQASGGEPRTAIGELQLLIDQGEMHGMRAQSGPARVALACAWLRAGDPQRAIQLLAGAQEISLALNDRLWMGLGLLARGRAALALKDWACARASLDEAMLVFTDLGARIEVANTLVVQAELARVSGDLSLEREHLSHARRLYVQCGAEHAAAQLTVDLTLPLTAS